LGCKKLKMIYPQNQPKIDRREKPAKSTEAFAQSLGIFTQS
jgi:hypothetical protein